MAGNTGNGLNCWKSLEIAENGYMAGNGWTWLEMAGNGRNGWKWLDIT